jgi:hypothetical protein
MSQESLLFWTEVKRVRAELNNEFITQRKNDIALGVDKHPEQPKDFSGSCGVRYQSPGNDLRSKSNSHDKASGN